MFRRIIPNVALTTALAAGREKFLSDGTKAPACTAEELRAGYHLPCGFACSIEVRRVQLEAGKAGNKKFYRVTTWSGEREQVARYRAGELVGVLVPRDWTGELADALGEALEQSPRHPGGARLARRLTGGTGPVILS